MAASGLMPGTLRISLASVSWKMVLAMVMKTALKKFWQKMRMALPTAASSAERLFWMATTGCWGQVGVG